MLIFVFDFPSFLFCYYYNSIFYSSIMFLQRSFAFLPFKSQARMGLVSLFYGSLGLNCPVFLVLLCSFIYPNMYLLYIYLTHGYDYEQTINKVLKTVIFICKIVIFWHKKFYNCNCIYLCIYLCCFVVFLFVMFSSILFVVDKRQSINASVYIHKARPV